jgi:hypothetical protein
MSSDAGDRAGSLGLAIVPAHPRTRSPSASLRAIAVFMTMLSLIAGEKADR